MGFVCVRIGCKVGLADGWNGKSATSAQICFLIEIEGGEDEKAVKELKHDFELRKNWLLTKISLEFGRLIS